MCLRIEAIAVLLCLGWPGCAAETANEAVGAVRNWYRTIGDGSDQASLVRFGTVGSGPEPLSAAYRQLAPSLLQRLTEGQFRARYRGLARLKLLQAQAAGAGPHHSVRVFVEEERILAVQDISAVTWYAGFLEVVHTNAGWSIADLAGVQPEDIISLELGGHMPWRADPEEVARIRANRHAKSPDCACKVVDGHRTASGEAGGALTLVVEVEGARYQERLARLHSGEWVVLEERPQPADRR